MNLIDKVNQLNGLIAFIFGAGLLWLTRQSFIRQRFQRQRRMHHGALFLSGICLGIIFFPISPIAMAHITQAQSLGLLANWPDHWVSHLLLSLLLLDGLAYLWHRNCHRNRLLWRLHQLRHEDPIFDGLSFFRIHPVEVLMTYGVFLGGIVFIGASPEAVLTYCTLCLLVSLMGFGCQPLPLKWHQRLGFCIMTPNAVRCHYASATHEAPVAFGLVFSFWDRLFKTWPSINTTMPKQFGCPPRHGQVSQHVWDSLQSPFRSSKPAWLPPTHQKVFPITMDTTRKQI